VVEIEKDINYGEEVGEEMRSSILVSNSTQSLNERSKKEIRHPRLLHLLILGSWRVGSGQGPGNMTKGKASDGWDWT
jgi:hypothetical protein